MQKNRRNNFLLGFWATISKTVRLCYRSVVWLSVLSVCNVGVLWPNGMQMKLGMQIGLGPGNIVLGGDPAPLP